LTRYLQSRNPGVPGIVNKLHAPTARRLARPQAFWLEVRHNLGKASQIEAFHDIYSGSPLSEVFSIDHFLPWSFVAHDLLWNLAPVEARTNSSKSDAIPDLDCFLPQLVALHRSAIGALEAQPKLLEDYFEFFGGGISDILALDAERFTRRFMEAIIPQAQIAINLGFPSAWRPRL
jgi:hypothetical protein